MFLEGIFEGYETITGQTIIKYNTNSFGEIFHIHGDISSIESIVITQNDYDEWNMKQKYISAKLITYFAEHPVFIFGYALKDENIKSILRDIGEIVSDESGLIKNVYQVIWDEDSNYSFDPPEQNIFSVDGQEFRINAIYANDFSWIYEALKSQSTLNSVNTKLVRALAARTMRLIRHDIPSGKVSVNYDTLERVAENDNELPTLLGISLVGNLNQSHPLTITQVAQELGYKNWNRVSDLIDIIKNKTGINLRESDNIYHCQIKTGKTAKVRKWSHMAVDLFRRVKEGLDYEVKI